MSTVYPSAKSPAFALAMASVGPAPEWAWLDYLSPGDAARVALLRQIQRESDTPADVREAARTAYNILREIAGWRMAEAPRVEQSFSMTPEAMKREVAECFAETVKARTVVSRVNTIAQLMANGLYRGKATTFSLATEWGVSPDIVREHARVAASQLIG